MKTFRGYRVMHQSNEGEPTTLVCKVNVISSSGKVHPLNPRLDIRNHSPAGFEWGYGGSGPAQLALALVANCCGKRAAVPAIYQRVKAIVAKLPHDGWTLTEQQIKAAVAVAR